MPTSKKPRRLVPIADLHAGHRGGLTPPGWWWNDNDRVPSWKRAWARVQRELWEEYLGIAEEIGAGQAVALVGDAIEGRGSKTAGTELITSSVLEQIEMACEAVRVLRPSRVVVFRGTRFHVSEDGDDAEDLIAQEFNCEVLDHGCLDFDGKVFDVRHHNPRSGVPYGRGTPLAREWVNNVLLSARNEAPTADVVLRAHVHYWAYVGGPGWVAHSIPPLQAKGSKHGERVVGGTVDWGIIEFWIEDGRVRWREHIKALVANKMRIVKL